MKRLAAILAVAAILAAQPVLASGITDSAVATTAKFIHRTLIFPYNGAITGAITSAATWSPHENIVVLNVDGSCRAVDTITVANCDVKNGSTSIMTTKPDIFAAGAGVVAAGVLDGTKTSITAGATLHINFGLTGTSITDCVCAVTYRTLGYGE